MSTAFKGAIDLAEEKGSEKENSIKDANRWTIRKNDSKIRRSLSRRIKKMAVRTGTKRTELKVVSPNQSTTHSLKVMAFYGTCHF